MTFHPSINRSAIRDDLVGVMTWAQQRSMSGQIGNFAQTYTDYRSGNVTEAKAGARRGVGYALDTALMASLVGGGMAGGGVHTYRALGMGKRLMKLNKSLAPHIFKVHILWEIYEQDFEWQDIPYYAAPWVASQAWDRYTTKSKSSRVARRGNAVGPRGGKKKKTTSIKDRSGRRLRGDGTWAPAKRGRCKFTIKYYRAKRQRCNRRIGHSGAHTF